MKQTNIFKSGEAKRWLERNAERRMAKPDPVIDLIDSLGFKPRDILEVGGADGSRVLDLRAKFGCVGFSIDPLYGESADVLREKDRSIDLLIYGFCLYLCDPEDYFQIAKEGDRVLQDGGYLIIHDFLDPAPFKTPYKHCDGVYSHHFDFSQLWLAHPAYSLCRRIQNTEDAIVVLKKNLASAFPVQE